MDVDMNTLDLGSWQGGSRNLISGVGKDVWWHKPVIWATRIGLYITDLSTREFGYDSAPFTTSS